MDDPVARFAGWGAWVLILIAGVFCGGLVFPFYFWATRKSALGVLLGLGFAAIAFVIAGAVTVAAAMVL